MERNALPMPDRVDKVGPRLKRIKPKYSFKGKSLSKGWEGVKCSEMKSQNLRNNFKYLKIFEIFELYNPEVAKQECLTAEEIDGSVVKSTNCSCTRQEFDYQGDARQLTASSNASSQGVNTLL